MDSDNTKSDVEILTGILKQQDPYGLMGPTVQRSHRFPADMFNQIENMARMGNVTVSVIINLLLSAGIEAVSKNLDKTQLKALNKASAKEYKTKAGRFGILAKRVPK